MAIGDRKLDFMAKKEDFTNGVSLYMRERVEGISQHMATEIVLSEYKNGEIVDPLIKLRVEEAQQLMDSLWDCGLRPSEGTGSAGSLRATENHLKDMRKIAFNRLKIDE